MQNADFSPLRGLGTDAFWLSFVEKKGAVKARDGATGGAWGGGAGAPPKIH